jgi:hypothetical protein
MPFIGNKPSAVPLTSADIADGIITSAKIVDGTIVNADINASAAIATSKLSGGTNTPAFFAFFNTGITLTQNVNTLVKYDSVTFDTDSAYSTSTGKFTVPSGKAGKYFFSASVNMANNFGYVQLFIYKNGSEVVRGIAVRNDQSSAGAYGLFDLTVGDEIQIFCTQDQVNTTGSGSGSVFSGFKLI